jgi:predicted permease
MAAISPRKKTALAECRAVIISDRLWQARFARNPAALGKLITLSGVDYTIIGILQPGFRFENQPVDVYTPLGRGEPLFLNDRTNHDILCVARLGPAVNLGQAQAEMNRVQEHIDQLHTATERGLGIEIEPLKQYLVGDVSSTLLLLLGAAGLVLLIACANVANLLLARSAVRTREFAVRLALGASRLQIVRQLVTESVVLSLVGGVLGLAIAEWGPKAVLSAMPRMPRAENIGVNIYVLFFTVGLSVVVGMVFGLVPALKSSKADLQMGLKEGGRGSAGRQQRAQGVLVIVQIALALVLLTGGGLLVRSIQNLWAVNPGFNTQRLITFQVGLSPSAIETPSAIRTAYRQLTERIRQIPGVQAADMTALVPLSQQDNSGPFWVGSHKPAVSMAEIPRALYFWTGPEYLRAMEIPLLRGRFLSESDTHESEPVIVIDNLLARGYFADRDPIGQTVTVPHWGTARVVGVVGHVRHGGLDGAEPLHNKPEIYASFYQLLDEWVPEFRNNLRITVRTSLAASKLIPAIQKTVYGAGSGQPVYNVHAMQEIVAASIAPRRFSMILLSAFAMLALLLACVGIYGVIAYSMTQRVHEIGIRMALGAVRRDVLRMVIGQGLRLALIGVTSGVAAAFVLTRMLSSFSHLLYGVGAADPLTFIGIPVVLLSAALLACYVPAWRAARLDPMCALRHE